MPAPIKVAVTGLGIARVFLHFYRECPDTKLVLLHDLDEARAKAAAAECPGAKYTLNFEEVLSSDVDMVDISTPNHIHPAQTLAALKAGKHVLCQKPMAPSVAECRSMCEAARASGKTLGMFMELLYVPVYHSLRAMVQCGLLGKIASIRIRCAHRGPLLQKDKNHWRSKQANIGGGSFMQLGIHVLNLIQWILNDEVVRVSGFAKNLYCQHSIEGEDVVAAAGEMRSGALIVMESGYSSPGWGLSAYGTEGHFSFTDEQGLELEANAPYSDGLLNYPGTDGKVGQSVTYPRSLGLTEAPKLADAPHIQQLEFARAIRAGKPAPVAGEVGLRDVAIIQAIYRAANLGRTVDVSEMKE